MSALARTEAIDAPSISNPQFGPALKLSTAAQLALNAPAHIDDFGFDPPEEITTQILGDLAHSECSMLDIARRAHTPLESLARWISRPDISARLSAIEATYARRARLNIAAYTPIMIEAAVRMIRDYNENEIDIGSSTDPSRLAIASRSRQTALAACRILLRLNREHAPAARTTSSPRATEGRRSERTSALSTSDADQALDVPLDESRSSGNVPCDNDARDIAAPRPEGPPVHCRGRQPTEPMSPNSSSDFSAEPQRGDSILSDNSKDIEQTSQASNRAHTSTTASPCPSASSPPRMHPPPESP